MKEYKVFFDRSIHSIEGFLTLQVLDTETKKVTKIFDKIKARSGQKGWTATSWITGKSPTPFGKWFLYIDKCLQPEQEPGATGIGEFWNIGMENDRHTIKGQGIRKDCGLHGENNLPGSAGCVVVVDRSKRLALFKELRRIHQETGLDKIPIEVM